MEPFLSDLLKNWKVIVPTLFLVWLILTLIQVYILEKPEIFSLVHGFLVSCLITL